MEIKGLAAATANRLGFLGAYTFVRRKLAKSQVAILMYHRVCPKKTTGLYKKRLCKENILEL